jgi:hypothetical protein
MPCLKLIAAQIYHLGYEAALNTSQQNQHFKADKPKVSISSLTGSIGRLFHKPNHRSYHNKITKT